MIHLGLDARSPHKTPPEAGEIRQERSDALDKNLSKPIPHFAPDASPGEMADRGPEAAAS